MQPHATRWPRFTSTARDKRATSPSQGKEQTDDAKWRRPDMQTQDTRWPRFTSTARDRRATSPSQGKEADARRKMAPDIGSGGRSVPDKRSEATLMVTAAYIASQMRGQAAGDHRSSGHVRRHQSKCRQSDQRLDHKPPLPLYNQKPTPRALSSYRYSSQ